MLKKKREYFIHFKKRIGTKLMVHHIFNKEKKIFRHFMKQMKFDAISKIFCSLLLKIYLKNTI
jgi:hypothetical protein